MKLRITLLIPALLVIVTIASSTFTYVYSNKIAEQQIRNEAKAQLRLDITRLQNILYNLLTENNLAEARLNISVMAMDAAINNLVLVDEREEILIANHYRREGEHISSLANFNPEAAKQITDTNQPHVDFQAENDTLLQGYYPVVLKIEDTNGLPIKRIGILFTELSIAHKLQLARQAVINQSAIQAGFMLTTALIIALLLHFLVSKRLASLTRSAAHLVDDDLQTNISVGGNDELTELANAFDNMRTRVKRQIHSLEEAETSLRGFNDTLEQRIGERTELLSDAQRIAHIGNWIWEIDNDKLTWSDEIYRLLGYSVGEITPSIEFFMSLLDKEDTLRVNEAINHTLESGCPYSVDHRITLADGRVRWLHEEGYLKQDNDGANRRLIGTAQDITQHKDELDRRKSLEKQLLHAQKMESLGQLTGGIAHDFNNILASILGFTQLAQRLEVSKSHKQLSQFLSFINESGQRAASMISQMLTYSRSEGDVEDKQRLSAADLFADTVSMLQPLIPSNINLHTQTDSGDLIIDANLVMMSQVLTNLCLNARDSLGDNVGEIRLEANSLHGESAICSSCHQPIEGDFVAIHVIDNGSGINADIVSRIFDPFFSTKGTGKGTGMGLSMVHGIIHSHGGHIGLSSIPGQGTTISVYLPQVLTASEPDAVKADVEPPDIYSHEHKHILVVDDEVTLTDYLGELLEMHGFRVARMNDSPSALVFFEQHKELVDAVISDQTMPGLLGSDMAQRMLKISPTLPFILCTGYSESINEQQALGMGISAFMKKPVDADELLRTLNKLLLQNS